MEDGPSSSEASPDHEYPWLFTEMSLELLLPYRGLGCGVDSPGALEAAANGARDASETVEGSAKLFQDPNHP